MLFLIKIPTILIILNLTVNMCLSPMTLTVRAQYTHLMDAPL